MNPLNFNNRPTTAVVIQQDLKKRATEAKLLFLLFRLETSMTTGTVGSSACRPIIELMGELTPVRDLPIPVHTLEVKGELPPKQLRLKTSSPDAYKPLAWTTEDTHREWPAEDMRFLPWNSFASIMEHTALNSLQVTKCKYCPNSLEKSKTFGLLFHDCWTLALKSHRYATPSHEYSFWVYGYPANCPSSKDIQSCYSGPQSVRQVWCLLAPLCSVCEQFLCKMYFSDTYLKSTRAPFGPTLKEDNKLFRILHRVHHNRGIEERSRVSQDSIVFNNIRKLVSRNAWKQREENPHDRKSRSVILHHRPTKAPKFHAPLELMDWKEMSKVPLKLMDWDEVSTLFAQIHILA